MSTGNVNLDLLLSQIEADRIGGTDASVHQILKRYPTLSELQAKEIFELISEASSSKTSMNASLVATIPPSFSVKAKSTKNTVEGLIQSAEQSILITGYSLSGYFNDLVDTLIEKSQKGVFIKFFVNNVDGQKNLTNYVDTKVVSSIFIIIRAKLILWQHYTQKSYLLIKIKH